MRSSCHKFRLVVTGLNVQCSFKQIYHCHGIYLNNLRCVHVSQTISLSVSLLELPPPIRPYINNKNYFIWCARPSYVWPVLGKLSPYLRFVPYTTSVKMFSLLLKKSELVCVGVKILNVVYFGVKKSGISVLLVSSENGAGVNKNTNINLSPTICSQKIYSWVPRPNCRGPNLPRTVWAC